jgi:hypothetical protein
MIQVGEWESERASSAETGRVGDATSPYSMRRHRQNPVLGYSPALPFPPRKFDITPLLPPKTKSLTDIKTGLYKYLQRHFAAKGLQGDYQYENMKTL